MNQSTAQMPFKEHNGSFQSLVEAISRTLNLPASVWVLDKERQALTIAASVGLPSRYVREAVLFLSEGTVTGEAYTTKQVVIVRDVLSDPRWKYKDMAREMGWKSALCVPIMVHGLVVGVLSVYTFVIRDFSDMERQLLANYASQIGLTLEAAKREETLSRLLDIGDDFARLITEQPKVVLEEIVRGACEITGAGCAVIYPCDPAREEFYDIDRVAAHGLTKPLELSEKPRSEKGMAAYVKRAGEVVVSNIKEEDPAMLKSPFIEREGIEAFMGIALEIADRVLGILYVDFRTPHQFSDEEKNTIRLFAHQAAIAVDNSRLYQQAAARAEALKKLHEVVPDLVSIPGAAIDLRGTLARIVQGAQGVLGADLVDLYEYIQSRDEYVLPPILVGQRHDTSVRKDKIYADDVASAVIRNKQPLYVADSQQEAAFVRPYTVVRPDSPPARFVVRESIKSTAAVPLVVGTEVVGVIFANYRSPQTFSQPQTELIELFASQSAIAIRNARLLQQRKALQDIARDITSILDKDVLLQKILDRSLGLLGCEIGSICLLDKATNQLEFQYAIGKERYLSVPFGKGLIGTAAETRKPVRVGDVTEDKRYIKHVEETRSELDVPMLIGEVLVGVLNAESTRPDAFDAASEELAVALASQAAVVLYNAALFEHRSALVDFGQAVTSGIRLRENEVLELIHRQASKLMDTNNMYIALYDKATDTVRFGLAFVDGERIDVATAERWQPRKAGRGRTEEIIRTKKPILTTTKEEAEAWYAQPERKDYLGRTFASWLGVPMIVGEKVLGVIATYHPTRDYVYSGDDLVVLQAMAYQAATALDNAYMFYYVNQRLEALVRFGQAVASGIRLCEGEVLELIHKQASQLMDTDNMYIALYDEATDTVRFGLAFVDGSRLDIATEEGWRPRRAGQGRTEWIIRNREPIFTVTQAEGKAWYEQPGHKEYTGGQIWPSWMGVPMMVGEKVLGAIATYHPMRAYVYTGEDLDILQAIASQAAVALNEVRAYAAWQQEQERRMAEEKYVYLGHAADGIAHRINNTISLLPLCTRDIRKHLKTVDGFVDEQLDMIARNAKYILALAEELQKPSRLSEAGHFDINELIKDAMEAVGISSSIDVVAVFDKSLPRVQTRRMVVDVFVELITNAVTAMAECPIKKLEIGSRTLGANFVEAWVKDTGKGVSIEEQGRLFDLFYTTAQKEEPTAGVSKGFGLWWVRTFLASQGGEIAVESEPGKGAIFLVRLPLEVRK